MNLSAEIPSEVCLPDDGFVEVNGVRLHYLDWGGPAPCLILIHGLGDNPYLFADLAPAFTPHFRVIAYARRGHGRTEARPPYDCETLTTDLLELMDALGIARADLAGYSMGGNEITAMAARHPERVRRIVYLDAGYDYADPDFVSVHKAVPPVLRATPPEALSSLEAYRTYCRTEYFAGIDDMRRVEPYIRDSVTVCPDGTIKVTTSDVMQAVETALLADGPREYTRVRSPALAIYAQHAVSPLGLDQRRQRAARAWERRYHDSFRERSIERIRREIAEIEVVRVSGGHNDFLFTSRHHVVNAMKRFLCA